VPILRRLTLLRHGLADEHPDDFTRTLNEAGRAAAIRAGEALARAGWKPVHVLTSAAPRALATAELAMKACGYSGKIRVEHQLYLASDAQYRAVLRQSPADAPSVLLVGHNPGLTRLAHDLCEHEGDLAPAEFATVELELDSWRDL
jgi:phosphohistidine phosphatase